MSSGTVFDIQHYSLHDGPGIRTTVFMKGCPLSCRWCQNPEGRRSEIRVWHFEKKCISCGMCARACPSKSITIVSEGRVDIDRRSCIRCGKCVSLCPSNALAFDGTAMSAEEVETEAAKDIVFYESSIEGGVTLSGGEPLAQGEFAVDILQRCRRRGIRTAIETCLYADPSVLRAVEPLVDFFIADIKILDQEAHRIATGVPNERILENFRMLARLRRGRDDLLVRIPLIPGYTANDSNIGAIALFVAGIDEAIPMELVNFNPLAESKFARMGELYEFVGQMPFTEEAIASFEEIAARSGAKVHKNKAMER